MSTSTRPSPKSFLKLSADISSFYGFQPAHDIEPLVAKADRGSHTFQNVTKLCAMALASRFQTAKTAYDPLLRGPIPRHEPILTYYATPITSHTVNGILARDLGEFGLCIVGTQESMGEVLLIKVIAAILEEWGSPVTSIRLNALGDKDNQQRFAKELIQYFRKHPSLLEIIGAQKMAENPILAYRQVAEKYKDDLTDAPRSINFLSEKNRLHFRSILEQLEILGLPYQLDTSLVCDDREQRTMFVIDSQEDGTICATIGGRYDEYVKKLTGRKESATVHGSILFKRVGIDRTQCTVVSKRRGVNPKVYFVQLGASAKLQGLMVVDMLRAARIPVMQSFESNHLTEQLAAANHADVSHVLIMGQREALDKTIIVRSADQCRQSTVLLSQLPRYLKTLRI